MMLHAYIFHDINTYYDYRRRAAYEQENMGKMVISKGSELWNRIRRTLAFGNKHTKECAQEPSFRIRTSERKKFDFWRNA